MIVDVKQELLKWKSKSIFDPDLNCLSDDDWVEIMDVFILDYRQYYSSAFLAKNIKYYPGLVSTFFYRISRFLFLKNDEMNALEYASMGFSLTGVELYYSASIGKSFKLNHGVSTIVGARSVIGDNVLLHHSVTLGDKRGGRPTIGNNVVIYPGAVIVGAITIGDNSIIGANVFVDKSCPANSKII
jgi:serine O-acetyltransferase